MPPVASEAKFATLTPMLPNPAARASAGLDREPSEPFAALLEGTATTDERPADKPPARETRRNNANDSAKTSARTSEKTPAKPRESNQSKGKDDSAPAEKADSAKADSAEASADGVAPQEADAAGNAKLAGEAALAEELKTAEQAQPDAEAPADGDAAPDNNLKPVDVIAASVAIKPDAAATVIAQAALIAEATTASAPADTAALPAITGESDEAAPAKALATETEIMPTAAEAPKAKGKQAAPATPIAVKANGETAKQDTDTVDAEHAAGKPAEAAPESEADAAAKVDVKRNAPAHNAIKSDAPPPAVTPAADNTAPVRTGAEHAQPIVYTQPLNHAAAAVEAAPALAAQQNAAVPVSGIAVEIAAKAVSGKNRFEIRLDPPELGRIDVRLDVDRHGQVTSRLVVERADTLDLLRRDAAGLERALQDAGLKTADNGLQFSLRDQSGQQERNADTISDAAQLIVSDDALPAIDASQRGYRRIDTHGGIDIRV